MARFIDLDSIDPNHALWLMPSDWIQFDQREPPWPNALWPYAAFMSAVVGSGFDQTHMIGLRRWCERHLSGDVVVRFISELYYQDTVAFYLDNQDDFDAFYDQFAAVISRIEEPM